MPDTSVTKMHWRRLLNATGTIGRLPAKALNQSSPQPQLDSRAVCHAIASAICAVPGLGPLAAATLPRPNGRCERIRGSLSPSLDTSQVFIDGNSPRLTLRCAGREFNDPARDRP